MPIALQNQIVYLIVIDDYIADPVNAPGVTSTIRLAFTPIKDASEGEMNDIENGAIDINNLDNTDPEGPLCFLFGTKINTPNGPVAIENIQEGDLVIKPGFVP